MREHMGLYRGKRVDNGEWIEGYYVRLFDGKGDVSHRIYSGYAETDCGEFYPDWFEVDPDTIGECTGLKDKKNGKLIFEGDIFDWRYAGVKDYRYVVAYDPEMASFVGDRGYGFVTLNDIDVEIIGNINDNPELMKGAGDDATD